MNEEERRELAVKILKESFLLVSALGFGIDVKFPDTTQVVLWPGVSQEEVFLSRLSEPDEEDIKKHLYNLRNLL